MRSGMNTEDIREAISANLVFKEHQIGVGWDWEPDRNW